MIHAIAKRWMVGVGVLGVVTFCQAQAESEAELSTLFFSAEQRKNISQSRQLPQGGTVKETLKRYSGVVKRMDGQHVIWLNNKEQKQEDPLMPLLIGADVMLQGKRLRVGDAVDTSSGTHKSLLPEGAFFKGN